MNNLSRFWGGLVTVAIASGALAAAVSVRTSTAKPAAALKSVSVASAGLRVQIDPVTGRIVPPRAKQAEDPGTKAAFPNSHAGLVEEPGTSPAGGFKVHAQGRFQSAVAVHLGPDGKPSFSCVDSSAADPSRK